MGATPHNRIVWLDAEFTHLDPAEGSILELAAIVTDPNTNVIEKFDIVIHHSNAALASMSPWCMVNHARKDPITGKSLIEDARASPHSLADATSAFVAFLRRHNHPNTKMTLGGSSVWKDRTFLDVHMPEAAAFLHHAIIDVSTLMEISRRLAPGLREHLPRRTERHRALDDAMESIVLMRFFRQFMFAQPDTLGERQLPVEPFHSARSNWRDHATAASARQHSARHVELAQRRRGIGHATHHPPQHNWGRPAWAPRGSRPPMTTGDNRDNVYANYNA